MHGADIIQHVAVLQHDTAEEHHEVEAPHHLAEASDAEVPCAVVVREVPEAGHPDITRNEDADSVVYLTGFIVVVQQEQHLPATAAAQHSGSGWVSLMY